MPLLRRSTSSKFWQDQGEVKAVAKTPPMPMEPSRFDPFARPSLGRQGTPPTRLTEPLPPLPRLPSNHSGYSDRVEPLSCPSSSSSHASHAPSAAGSSVHWPTAEFGMPADTRQRALWFLGQVVMSHDVLPGAFITPRIFVPSQTWQVHMDSLCARQLSMRAAFLESVARAMGDLVLTPKISHGLQRKLGEIWEHSLNLHMQSNRPASAPSPPLSDIEQFPGPVRIRRGPRSHLRSLVSRRSASPDPADDRLYQFSPPHSLPKYIEAVDSILVALEKCSPAWRDFVVFSVVAHIADDVLDIHERYMESVRFDLLGLA